MTRINDSQAIFKDIRLLRLLVVHPDDAMVGAGLGAGSEQRVWHVVASVPGGNGLITGFVGVGVKLSAAVSVNANNKEVNEPAAVLNILGACSC